MEPYDASEPPYPPPVTPEEYPYADKPASLPKLGVAIAALVLGILSLCLSFLVVPGVIQGLVGLCLAIVILSEKSLFKSIGISSIILSVLGILASILFGVFYVWHFHNIQKQWPEGIEETAWEVWIGKPAPDFTATDLDGKPFTLSQCKGKRVILDFWATWCPPCVKEIPHFVELRKTTSPDELVILGISDESPEILRAFVPKHNINYPIFSASDLPEPFPLVTSFPTTFFIDRNGVIQQVLEGYHDFDILKTNAIGPDYVSAEPSDTDPASSPAASPEIPPAEPEKPGDDHSPNPTP